MTRETFSAFGIFAAALGLGLGLSACRSDHFAGPEKLASTNKAYVDHDNYVPASVLNLGYDTYNNYCMQCHGLEGKGNGPAAQGMYPPPRNFTQGLFKFVSGKSGDLPSDEDLKKTIRYGLRGTHMLPWDLSEERLDAVIQYVKTFAPAVWREGAPGVAWESHDDPWKGREADAVLLGKKVYHGLAQCYTCHPSYVSPAEINEYSKELTGGPAGDIRADAHLSVLQDSSYGHKYMPPDYTKNWIKTMRFFKDEHDEIADIYRLIGSGVGGTTMPSWEGVLSSDADETKRAKESHDRQWAVAYYVHSLHKLKFDLNARKKFFEELNAKRLAGQPTGGASSNGATAAAPQSKAPAAKAR